jgi:hypothetical protein
MATDVECTKVIQPHVSGCSRKIKMSLLDEVCVSNKVFAAARPSDSVSILHFKVVCATTELSMNDHMHVSMC